MSLRSIVHQRAKEGERKADFSYEDENGETKIVTLRGRSDAGVMSQTLMLTDEEQSACILRWKNFLKQKFKIQFECTPDMAWQINLVTIALRQASEEFPDVKMDEMEVALMAATDHAQFFTIFNKASYVYGIIGQDVMSGIIAGNLPASEVLDSSSNGGALPQPVSPPASSNGKAGHTPRSNEQPVSGASKKA